MCCHRAPCVPAFEWQHTFLAAYCWPPSPGRCAILAAAHCSPPTSDRLWLVACNRPPTIGRLLLAAQHRLPPSGRRPSHLLIPVCSRCPCYRLPALFRDAWRVRAQQWVDSCSAPHCSDLLWRGLATIACPTLAPQTVRPSFGRGLRVKAAPTGSCWSGGFSF